jgi:glycerol-3-phosphate dehydrogenase subunit C
MSSRIESRPTDGLTYNPNDSKYWDRGAFEKEETRIYDICHGCRLCFNLRPSFPALFDAIDAKGDDVRSLTVAERERVVDLCYGCRLCYQRCPYTPRDGHDFQLDFPQLMQRGKAIKVKERGLGLRERMLGDPDRLGRISSLAPGLANWANKNPLQRLIMERTVGIHRKKKLPEFAHETFEHWLSRRGLPAAPAAPAAKVALFYTCILNFNNPAPAQAAVEVFAKNNCALACPSQNCCGMPALDGGDIEFAKKEATANVASLLPLVREGWRVAAMNPTCALMLREEYPRLLGTDDARTVADAVADPHELLYELRRKDLFNREFRSTPGSIAYHVPCHLKAQNIGLRSRDLMRLIPEVQVTGVDACCAHDGTWAMKKEYFELSMKWGEKAFGPLREAGTRVMATDCSLAAIQIEQGTGTRPLHPIEVLARAYRSDGFDQPVMPQTPPAE